MNRLTHRASSWIFALSLSLATYGCGPNLDGTYQDDSGMVVLNLGPGDEATMTIMGQGGGCASYSVDGTVLTVVCDEGNLDFTVNNDGSLTGPPGAMFGALRRME
jgi:hypothetical protein